MYEEYTPEVLIQLVRRGFESLKVDYKQTLDLSNPKHQEELIKDVSAMANTVVPDDTLARIGLNPKVGFLLIGISEKDGEIHDIPPGLDDARLQQIVNSRVEPNIMFLFRPFEINQAGTVVELGAIIIRESAKPPHKISKPYGKKLRPGQCFVREGTSTREADENDLETMYAHRLTERPPCILPSPLTDFLDRQDDLSQIEEAVRSFRTVGIFGMAGVGKTALATHAAWLQRYYFPDGCSYHRVGKATAQALVGDIAERFGDKTVRAMTDYQQQLRVFRNFLGSKEALLPRRCGKLRSSARHIGCGRVLCSPHH